jgi:glycosyltransferase involved in cell wall biosynthesis
LKSYGENPVTVVVPTYNRAHLIPRTLPTFLNGPVAQVIVIDDASSDATPAVMEGLLRDNPRLRYHRLERNGGLPNALNTGLALANTPLIYFGDDDTILLPGTMEELLRCRKEEGADIASARAVYMLAGETVEQALARTKAGPGCVVKIQSLRTYFDSDPGKVIPVPYAMPCSLMPTTLAASLRFDTAFGRGSAYRGDSDFFLRCSEAGAKIVFCPKAVSVNLPREESTGGVWSGRWLSYETSAIRNNWLFLRRHHRYLKEAWSLHTPLPLLQVLFVGERLSLRSRQLLKRALGPRFAARIRVMQERRRGAT